jgi:hypothetical protein
VWSGSDWEQQPNVRCVPFVPLLGVGGTMGAAFFEPMETLHNGEMLFKQHHANDDLWLLFTHHRWIVTNTVEKDAKNDRGYWQENSGGRDPCAKSAVWQSTDLSGAWRPEPDFHFVPARPVLLVGATGPNAPYVNGVFDNMSMPYNGKILFKKRGTAAIWLRHTTDNRWVVSNDSDKIGNTCTGWCKTSDTATHDPREVGSAWLVLSGSNWEAQPDVLCTTVP